MTGLEIFLIIAGILIIVVSFIISEKFENSKNSDSFGAQVDLAVISEEVVRQQVDIAAQNAVDETVEKTEAMLDKISTEKIMAVNDYSESVLDEINKNHEEVMFLYSMLNDKEKDIKNTIRDIENVKKTVNMIKNENISDEMQEDILIDEDKEEIIEAVKEEKAEEQEKIENKSSIRINRTINNNQKILDMYKQGISNIDIAKQLNIGIGEVRLVIDLFRSHSGN